MKILHANAHEESIKMIYRYSVQNLIKYLNNKISFEKP